MAKNSRKKSGIFFKNVSKVLETLAFAIKCKLQFYVMSQFYVKSGFVKRWISQWQGVSAFQIYLNAILINHEHLLQFQLDLLYCKIYKAFWGWAILYKTVPNMNLVIFSHLGLRWPLVRQLHLSCSGHNHIFARDFRMLRIHHLQVQFGYLQDSVWF